MAQPAIHNGVARLIRVTRQSTSTHKRVQRLPEGLQAREDRKQETRDVKGFKKPRKRHPSRAAIRPVAEAKSIIPSRPAQGDQGQPPVERIYHYATINVRTQSESGRTVTESSRRTEIVRWQNSGLCVVVGHFCRRVHYHDGAFRPVESTVKPE